MDDIDKELQKVIVHGQCERLKESADNVRQRALNLIEGLEKLKKPLNPEE